jgi:hypothetical protein
MHFALSYPKNHIFDRLGQGALLFTSFALMTEGFGDEYDIGINPYSNPF